jgi:hypothetical protein
MTSAPDPSTPNPNGFQRWGVIIAASGATAAGALAAYSPTWAVGVGTAASLFIAICEILRL